MPKIHNILKGTAFVIGLRWADRLIGLASTIILARLLIPSDFGIIAMASIAVGFAEMIFDLGVNIALIQNKNAEKEHYDSAWTIKIIQGFILFLALSISAPYCASYFNNDDISLVIIWMGIGILITSFENIGIVKFQKELDFSKEFRFLIAKRLFGFITTIGFALILKSYLAMVIGTIAAKIFGLILSFIIHPMRPKPSLKKAGEMLRVSQWLLLKNTSQFIDNNFHKLYLGGKLDTKTIGGYAIATEISDLPGTEILSPINRILFPLLANNRDDSFELKRIFNTTQGIHILFTMPACIGVCILAHEIVSLLFGEKWIFITPTIQILALTNIFQSFISASNYLLITYGRFKILVYTSLIQIGIFIGFISIGMLTVTAENVAIQRLLSIVIGCLISYCIFLKSIKLTNITDLINNCTRPIIGCMIMGVTLIYSKMLLINWTVATPKLLFFIALGATTYTSVVLILWLIQNKLPGAELFIIEKIHSLVKSKNS